MARALAHLVVVVCECKNIHTPSSLLLVEYIKERIIVKGSEKKRELPRTYNILIRFDFLLNLYALRVEIRIYLFVLPFIQFVGHWRERERERDSLLTKLLNFVFIIIAMLSPPCFFMLNTSSVKITNNTKNAMKP